ncbi:DUF6678 family protein (plasmid) [Fibrella sp. ES10-3-2-2]
MDKDKILKYLSKEGLVSFMNLTKWRELVEIIHSLPFPPAFLCKYLTVALDDNEFNSFNKETIGYWGDWSLNTEPTGLPALDEFYLIEYLRIKPVYAKYRGKYIADEVTDISDELKQKLSLKHIPFVIDDFKNIVIYGYK